MEDFFKFAEVGFKIGGAIIKGIWDFFAWIIGLFFEQESESPTLNDRYEAKFAEARDILYSRGGGFCINGKYSVSTELSLRGGIGIGGSGYGKTSTLLLPSAYKMLGHSLVFHDASTEIARYSAGYHKETGAKIDYLNWNNALISIGYNPLKRVKSITDMQKIAHLLVRSSLGSGGGADNFWNSQSCAFLTLLIAIALKQENKYRNMSNVKHLLDNYSSGSLDELVARCNDSFIFSEYKNFLSYETKVMSSIVATCRSALNIWNSPSVRTITSHDTIDFKAFRKNRHILYIQTPTLDLSFYSPLSSMFFEQFFAELMEELPTPSDLCAFFMIDEFSSLYIPSIQLAVSNLRKYKANCFLIVQSEHQIRHIYGDHQASSILQNMYSRIYFPGQDAETASRLSKMLGKRELEIEDPETGVKQKRIRELLTADEVMKLGENRVLAFIGTQALYLNCYPYYQQRTLKAYSEIPADPPHYAIPFTEVPLIPLKVHA